MQPEQRFEIYGDETYGRTGAPSRARLRRETRVYMHLPLNNAHKTNTIK